MNNCSYFNTCTQLVLADLTAFKKIFLSNIIDMTIWAGLTIFVTGYILPYFGLSQNFGAFQFGGVLASIGLFQVYGSVFELIADLEGDRVINYALTVPIPSWMAIVCKSAYYAIAFFILALMMFPLGKLFLWDKLSLASIAYGKLIIVLILQSIFYACFVPFIATFVSGISNMRSIWSRFIFPLWFMGGFQFSWIALYKIVPTIAYVDLINPVVYITEGTRAALLGQEGYLNFWVCCGMLLILSTLCELLAVYRMKKRLDFV